MEKVLPVLNWIVSNGPVVLGYIGAALTALIGIFMMVPGDAPEKQLKSVADFIAKFSKKPPV